jgi:MoaA/NifB/PqqE/SkfB family radical SAM enzyme
MSTRPDFAAAVRLDSFEPHRVTHLPVLVLHAHSSCNCRCVMCDIWKTAEARSLRLSDLEPHLVSIRRLGVRWVVFTGGEPLLNPALPSLCTALREEGIRLTLLTTGLLLKKQAKEVASSFDDVIVSLDGPESIHNSIRRVENAFALILAGVTAVKECNPRIRITARTTVQKANCLYLRETVQAAKTLGLDTISFLAADVESEAFNRPVVWPAARQNQVALSISDLSVLEIEIKALIRDHAADMRSGFIADSPEKLHRIISHFRAHLGLESAKAPPCNAPWTSAVIETDGTVRPCFFHPPLGNIRQSTLEEVINSKEALQFRAGLDILKNDICRRCVCSLNYRS